MKSEQKLSVPRGEQSLLSLEVKAQDDLNKGLLPRSDKAKGEQEKERRLESSLVKNSQASETSARPICVYHNVWFYQRTFQCRFSTDLSSVKH